MEKNQTFTNMEKENLLHKLDLPSDLKKLSLAELEKLAAEIREKLIKVCKECGGHLASNLGVVELTLALHSVLDSPKDKIIWDVSHQCYIHKMLTGRLDRISTIRQDDGLSGFTKISESEHDAFGTGHASTSLSAGLGMVHAREIRKEKYTVCSVIGDGSLSGGMAFEALNNSEKIKSNFICILNDNNMSISMPVGCMASYITRVRTHPVYNKAKHKFERLFEKIPKIGVPLKRKIERTVERLRDLVLEFKVGVLFEEFGFKYLGPLDGHNLPVVMAALKYAKNYPGPIMIHIITKKGKGHLPAEKNPTQYHGISPQTTKTATKALKTYTQVFGETIMDLAKKDPNIAAITPAMTEGSGLTAFSKKFPDRFFDVGIAEEHAVTFSAGLARANIKPVLAIYSTFLQRGFDQVIHDICLQNLPVIFAVDRAGIVGADGPTHHGIFDYSYLLFIPNLTILAPKDGSELKGMLIWALKQKRAVSIRYPRGSIPEQDGTVNPEIYDKKAELLFSFNNYKTKSYKVLIIAAGSMAWPSFEAANLLKEKNISSSVINLRFIKPLDKELLSKYIKKSEHIFVIEEGSATGGVSSYILKEMYPLNINLSQWHQIAIPDHFVEHGNMASLKKKYFLDQEGIFKFILKNINI